MPGSDRGVSRRVLFAAGGLGAAALMAGAGTAGAAARPTKAEAANAKLVKDFCEVWKAKDLDLGKAVATYLADDCVIDLVPGRPPAVGKAAAKALFESFMKNGERYELKVEETFARGPVVANARVDTTLAPGKPPESAPVVGVFVLEGGKIRKWSDYPVKA